MPNRITVVGLGPAGPEFVTEASRSLLTNDNVWLRTRRHPACVLVPDAPSFDDTYSRATTVEDVYPEIVETLVQEASKTGHVVYAVPGSPTVAEATVELLREDSRVDVRIVAGMSFLDLAWAALGVDPLAVSVRLVDGRRFAIEAAGERGPLLVAQCDAMWVLSDIKLAFEAASPGSVTVLQRLGLPDERVTTVDWSDLDRIVEPDHLTTLWIPRLEAPVAYELSRVEEVARRLRRDCPWDREQTHAGLGRYLIEESYELLEAIDAHADAGRHSGAAETQGQLLDGQSVENHLIEELGDVLFQVFAHAAIAAEDGRFNIADVAQTVSDKLIERHPHVYGDVVAETADDVVTTWEANKMAVKGRTSLMEGIPSHLPALAYASKVLKKAAGAGVGLNDADLAAEDETAQALLRIVDAARRTDVDPEDVLRRATTRFRRRFEEAEREANDAKR